MNEKEFNLAILAELKRIAKEVFLKVTINKEGTYTAAELWNEKNDFGERIIINYHKTENEVYTAEIGSFKMQITPLKLWYVLWKFEKLCNVKQADKIRFTYGKQEGENISEKAMFLDKEGKATARKKSLVKLSNHVAIEPDKKTKSYNMYYFASGLWYLVATNYEESQYKTIKERIEKDGNYLFGLLQKWDFNTENRLNPIYKALFDALKSERVNDTQEERKSENEPKKAVICDNVGTDAPEKSESVQETNEDYPPEPYNEANTDDIGQNIEKCIVEHVSDIQGKNMCPNYLRQKVFPTELFCANRKISRFKPRYFIGYTNYHLRKESALERKINGTTSVYGVLIRGETKNNNLTCRQTCFRL